uniref:G-protein coupled receptors family 1 profile domain-containing protein n=1 Tax=Bionectria ochroleuca TaxID=29856 RepID=A0A8H7N621_BIOOC
MAIDFVVAIPTLVGSWLSFLASTTAIVLQVVRPPRRHFRHALIINLLVSDAMNTLSNAISGSIFLAQGRMPGGETKPDAACIANAYINQLSVQTIDFNILVISITVLLTVLKADRVANLSIRFQALLCIAAWVPALITSNIALALNGFGYVSGNWCWIRADRLDLRYALTHGWRLFIFFATILIYTYIYIHLKRVFRRIRNVTTELSEASYDSSATGGSYTQNSDRHQVLQPDSLPLVDEPQQIRTEAARGHSLMPPPPNLSKMLLLNGYPIAYIILWIPGIANRLTESLNGASPQWLKALQASTQFIGLVNAVTYGLSEQMRQKAWKKIRGEV